MVNSRSTMFPWLHLIIILTGIIKYSEGQNNPSPHWERCRSILKQEYGLQTRECTQAPRIPCLAQKFQERDLGQTVNYCDGSDCPTAPSDLDVTLYKTRALAMNNDRYSFFGANVSWTIEKKGTPNDYGTKYFEARVEDGGNQTFIAKIQVNLTETDFVDNKAVIYYDCFYPFFRERRLATAIIKTIPHRRDVFLQKDFYTAEAKTEAPPSTTTETTPTSTATTTEISDASTRIATPPAPRGPAGSTQRDVATLSSKLEDTSGVVYGLVIGVAMIVLLAVTGLIVNKFWGSSRKPKITSRLQGRENEQINNQASTSGLRKVMLVCTDEEDGHRTLCRQLSGDLAEQFSCDVIEPSQIQVGEQNLALDVLNKEMESVDQFIVVSCQGLMEKLEMIERYTDIDVDLREESNDLLVLTLVILKDKIKDNPDIKAVTVFFNDTKPCHVTYSLSQWKPIPLMAGFSMLKSHLQGQTVLQKLDPGQAYRRHQSGKKLVEDTSDWSSIDSTKQTLLSSGECHTSGDSGYSNGSKTPDMMTPNTPNSVSPDNPQYSDSEMADVNGQYPVFTVPAINVAYQSDHHMPPRLWTAAPPQGLHSVSGPCPEPASYIHRYAPRATCHHGNIFNQNHNCCHGNQGTNIGCPGHTVSMVVGNEYHNNTHGQPRNCYPNKIPNNNNKVSPYFVSPHTAESVSDLTSMISEAIFDINSAVSDINSNDCIDMPGFADSRRKSLNVVNPSYGKNNNAVSMSTM